uniref:Uncharacterized protein n=1 Tax=Arundo donax TaxID=35708 RepID=A0A0A9AR56_ARUDO
MSVTLEICCLDSSLLLLTEKRIARRSVGLCILTD